MTTLATKLVSAPWPVFSAIIEDWDDSYRAKALFERCRVDRLAFFVIYLSDVFQFPFSRLHRELAAAPKQMWNAGRPRSWHVIPAPRASAKTTFLGFADLVHDACYGFEVFVGVISTTHSLADGLVKSLHQLFSDRDANPLLHDTYGPFVVKGTQTSFAVSCPGNPHRYGVTFRSYSMGGKRVRGDTCFPRWRPSKWILDDVVDPHTIHNDVLRHDAETFIDDDVGESGYTYTTFLLLGTRLHVDDVVSRKLNDPAWDGDTPYKAVEAFPDERYGLWEECRAIWATLELGNEATRKAAAYAFYEANRAAMDAGSRVLWPDHPEECLFPQMVRLWANPASFFREKQNNPSAASDAVFDVPGFRRCKWHRESNTITTSTGRVVALSSCKRAIWLDPIRYGRNARKRDKAALAVVARERTGRRYVLELHYVDGPKSAQRAKLWQLFDRFGYGPSISYNFEDNIGPMHLEEDFKREQNHHRNGHRLVLKPHNSQQRKEDRIARIEPDCKNGFIEFAEDLPNALWDEFRSFPGSAHDDGMDAVERADAVLQGARGVTVGGWTGPGSS